MPPITDPNAQRRRFTRVPFHTHVSFALEKRQRDCVLIDISLNGALIEDGDILHAERGTPCRLVVSLGDPGHFIRMDGVVAHATDGRLGIQCVEMDLGSVTTLRQLVVMNSGDEESLQRDLAALVAGS